ncbi:MAG: 1,4-alpha-glucan branching protein domain-containing protein [Candidatus Omnitrophota bacterium]
MEKGYLAIVLHSHLPYVRHPEYEDFLEEDWLYEAITETYMPLINVYNGLIRDGVDFRVTMSLTPTLCSMLSDPLLQDRYIKHLESLIELSSKEVERTRWEPAFNKLAIMYQSKFKETRDLFIDRYRKNILNAFKEFQDMGKLEIITCGATHGFLPLMEVSPKSVRAQIQVGANNYEGHFGRRPRGAWLAECGYYPGIDQYLKEAGIRYFFVDIHGILHGSPRPKYGVYAPVYCKSGVAAFGRDWESSKQVWSAIEGYPGDFNYREFYRDVGFDLDYEYIKPYIHKDGIRVNTGIKYYRITGKTNHKEPYNLDWARDRAAEHAGNFMFNRERQAEYLFDAIKKKPIIVAPYDAELFGHWWYEGPMFLDILFRKMHYDQKTVKLITPSEYLERNPRNQVITPSMSSWGYKGYSEHWLDGSNDWIYRHLHKASERMTELANSHPDANGLLRRALNQALRELLLAQSSDWAFIMKTGTVVQYAVKRTKDHILRFTKLYEDIKSNRVDEGWLKEIEWRDNIFPEADYRVHT